MGGLQLPTIQRDSEVLKKLPSWTRSTSLHTHARTHVLIAFHFILLPYKLSCGVGGGVGGVAVANHTKRDSEVLKKLPRWTRSTSLHTHARTHVLIAFHFILLPYKLSCGVGGGVGGVAVANHTKGLRSAEKVAKLDKVNIFTHTRTQGSIP